jgi:hypothetical protein
MEVNTPINRGCFITNINNIFLNINIMKLKFFTYYYDVSKVECIIPCPSIKYKSYYYTNNLTMYNNLITTTNKNIQKWYQVFDASLNVPFDSNAFQIFGNDWYIPPRITTQYSILNNPQYYIDLLDADYICTINYKTYIVDEAFIEKFILNYFIKTDQFCIFYKRYNNGMELLLRNMTHKQLSKRMLLLNEILCKEKDTYIL